MFETHIKIILLITEGQYMLKKLTVISRVRDEIILDSINVDIDYVSISQLGSQLPTHMIQPFVEQLSR